jgi:hypothetical protein
MHTITTLDKVEKNVFTFVLFKKLPKINSYQLSQSGPKTFGTEMDAHQIDTLMMEQVARALVHE